METKKLITEVYKNLNSARLLYSKGNLAMEEGDPTIRVHRDLAKFERYSTFQRFDCKAILTEALRYFSGASERVMIDNAHVVVLRHGTRHGCLV
ncbi:MAG: hypothetical protein DMG58_24655 [Acidobacteria bacterium]|nr:MAG: hypothetical protein DMG58_24655 [Acidobacteriota bacterium]